MTITPYVAIGNDELGDALGAEAKCPNCGEMHAVTGVTKPDGTPSNLLQFVTCGTEHYLVGINGRRWDK